MAHTYKRTLVNTLVLSALYQPTSAEIITDGTVGDAINLQADTNNTYEISSDLGQTSGNNLFHSFEQFNIETNYIADFSGPANIQNIINRVTGPDASNIDGTLRSSIQGANLYLLNPKGVIFGANASLDITGSFYVSTADYLKFGDNEFFYADAAEQYTFVSAEPSAFGFTSETPAAITVDGSVLSVDDSQTIAMIGGDIALDNGAYLEASDGSIHIASVASSGIVTTTSDSIEVSGFANLGDVSLTNSSGAVYNTEITTSGGSAGHIVIRSGTLVLDDYSLITADTGRSGSNTYSESIDIVAATAITLNSQSSITNNVGVFSSANTKGISLTTTNLNLNDGSTVEADTKVVSGGNSGDIVVNAERIALNNDSKIKANTARLSSGNAGDIVLNASDTLSINGFSSVESYANSRGNGGDITIQASNIELTDFGEFHTTARGEGAGGNIILNTQDLKVTTGAVIRATSRTDATTGNIEINSDNILLRGPESSDDPFGDDFTAIYTFKGEEARLSDGGNLSINNSEKLTLDSRSEIAAFNYGSEIAGNIDIDSHSINVLRGSVIGTEAAGSGNGGNITIDANEINVIGVHNEYSQPEGGNPKFYESTILTIGENSLLASGDTGNIELTAQSINVLDGGAIQTSALSNNGELGGISINTENLRVSGVNSQKLSVLSSTNIPLIEAIQSSSSQIRSSTAFDNLFGFREPPASIGELSIKAENIALDSGGIITTNTLNAADSANIHIETNALSINGGATISSAAISGRGNAGNISITTESLQIDGANSIATTSGIYSNTEDTGGRGGDILIRSETLTLNNNATISSETTGDSNSGNVEINSTELVYLSNGATVTAKASEPSTANAGNISLESDFLVVENGNITTSAVSGNGGDITVMSDNIVVSGDSTISAESEQSISGTVYFSSEANITSQLVQLSEQPLDISSSFRNECDPDSNTKNSFFAKTTSTFHMNLFNPSRYNQAMLISTNQTSIEKPEIDNETSLLNQSVDKPTITSVALDIHEVDCSKDI